VDVYRLPVDQAMQGSPVDAGWTRAIHRGPRTVEEVLRAASAAMDAEDEAERRQRDPFTVAIAPRRPSLLRRLLGR
jgi:hypothetical protein